MGQVYDGINDSLADWLMAQPVWFVGTAPLAAEGLVNVSPRGHDTFTVLGAHRVGWVDLTGSGIETVAQARRLYGSTGFVIEGVLRGEFRTEAGLVDDVLMAMALDEVADRPGETR